MIAAPDTRPCVLCGGPELLGYPHRHDTPPRPDHDPMGRRPERLYCAAFDVGAHWTLPDWRPDCCLVHVIAWEHRAELPDGARGMHPTRLRPPARTEPIPLHPGHPDGPQLDVLDAGAGWPWAAPAHRRFGARGQVDAGGVRLDTIDRRDWSAFPWAYAIERRLDGHCRRRHVTRPELWPEHAGGALCPRVVGRLVIEGLPPEWIAVELRIPAPRMRLVLDDALRTVWRFVSEELNNVGVRRLRRPRPAGGDQ